MYWKGGTRRGALAGLLAGFVLWVYTLMLPSVAKSGWLADDWGQRFVSQGPWGITLLRPEQLLGLGGLDGLTHSLFWSLLVNIGAYAAVSLWRSPSARETSQALLFVDVFDRLAPGMHAGPHAGPHADAPVFWRGRASLPDLQALLARFLGAGRSQALFAQYARSVGAASVAAIPADARLVQFAETQLAGAIGSASARVMVASAVEEESLGLDDVMTIIDEASQLRANAQALELKSRKLEQATAELRAANDRLLSLDGLKDDFMSSVTHELRTPLTSIRALSELMVDDPAMDAGQRQQFLAIIVAETERLTRLVNQVLDMAKIESGQAEWRSSAIDMRALLQRAVHTTAELFRERGATLTLALPDAVAPYQGDEDRLLQVLLNLLSNAAKFVPRQGGQVTLRLQADTAGLTVAVHDNGPGVPVEQRSLIFEKFRQGGQANHRPQGTGLGLPISRRIVAHFGGRMWLVSDPGQGATFSFTLPWPTPTTTPPPGMDPGPIAEDAEDAGDTP
jgi:signal transduction histidine kinase